MKPFNLGRVLLCLAAALAADCPHRAGAQSGPHTTPAIVDAAAAAKPEIGPGPVRANWDSIRTNYSVPAYHH